MSEPPRVTILPSPLLPAAAYAGLADALSAAGADSSVADPSLNGSETVDDLVRRWVRTIEGSELLVAHSNAGYLAPLVRARRGRALPIVFMDAALLPESGETPLAPPAFRTHLAGLVDQHGLLPPWTRWWPREVIDAVVPEGLFDDIDRECPRLPLSYFDQRVGAPPSWAGDGNAYLAFGQTYEEELGIAGSRAWPTRVMEGRHLHFLHEPPAVAELVLGLAQELTRR